MARQPLNTTLVKNPPLSSLPDATHWVIDTETTGLDVVGPNATSELRYIGAAPSNNTKIAYCWNVNLSEVASYFEKKVLIGHNLKFDLHVMKISPEEIYDTMQMTYFGHTTALLKLDFVAAGMGLPKIKTPKELKEGRIDFVHEDIVFKYLADDVATTNLAFNKLYRSLSGPYWHFDDELILATTWMEDYGVRFNHEAFQRFLPLVQELERSTWAKLQTFGFDGNLNSPPQVGRWLTKQRGHKLPNTDASIAKALKKNDDQWLRPKTGKMVLEKLEWAGHEDAMALRAARKANKLVTAFANPLPHTVQIDGIIRPDFRLAKTKTGRFSCANPNVQQVPKHSELGKMLRLCFTGHGGDCSTADYSQVEMRVAAALSGDPTLLDAFTRHTDIHLEVAAAVLGKRLDQVTKEERFGAKAINFGILNGMGAKRLAHEMRTTTDAAKRWLNDYLTRFDVMSNWMDATWSEAHLKRIIRTEAGRTRLYLSAESTRSAVSVRVQGTAAELMRRALVLAWRYGLRPMMVVHDEIVADTEDISGLISCMEEAANGMFPSLAAVNFVAEGHHGKSWGDSGD